MVSLCALIRTLHGWLYWMTSNSITVRQTSITVNTHIIISMDPKELMTKSGRVALLLIFYCEICNLFSIVTFSKNFRTNNSNEMKFRICDCTFSSLVRAEGLEKVTVLLVGQFVFTVVPIFSHAMSPLWYYRTSSPHVIMATRRDFFNLTWTQWCANHYYFTCAPKW